MRKIEERIIHALQHGEIFHQSRDGRRHDEVFYRDPATFTYILIYTWVAQVKHGKLIRLGCGCEYNTKLTKSRINAIARAFGAPTVYQRDFEWFWSDGLRYTGARRFDVEPKQVAPF